MVLEIRKVDDLNELLDDLQVITDNVRNLRVSMIEKNIDTVPLNDGTARSHLKWVKSWSESLRGVLAREEENRRKEEERGAAEKKREEIRLKRKKSGRKKWKS